MRWLRLAADVLEHGKKGGAPQDEEKAEGGKTAT